MPTKRTPKPKKVAPNANAPVAPAAPARVRSMTVDLTKYPHYEKCPYKDHGGTTCSWCIGHLAALEGVDAHIWNEGFMYAKVE